MASSEDEIYSIMFTSLKHPVRRKILRMLSNKPMTFMEMVENLGVSTSHLTYHLENLGELVSKLDDGNYKLSTFGLATVSAMNGVEEAPKAEPKRRWKLALKWQAVVAGLLIAVVVLAGTSTFALVTLNHVSSDQQTLAAQNKQLLSWGMGEEKVAVFLHLVGHIDLEKYQIKLLDDTMNWRQDLGAAEEEVRYQLTNSSSNLVVYFRFRDGNFSRYDLTQVETAPIFTMSQPNDVLQNAKNTLDRYYVFSNLSYVANMSSLLSTVNYLNSTAITQGNMKLQIDVSGSTVTFYWMYTDSGIDFQTKGLSMVFQNNVLVSMIDGYFLFTIGNTNLSISQNDAVNIARNYAASYTTTIQGQQISGLKTKDLISAQMVPHTRGGNSVALIPYWYIEFKLDRVYAGGDNAIGIGIYADTGQVADVNMLSTSTVT
jgi:DNA-binding transcriptional ArsR family regulator